MSMLARIDEERHDEVPVVRLEGEIDASNVERHRRPPARDAHQPLRRARRRPDGHDLSRQRGHQHCCSASASSSQRQQRLALVVPDGSPIARMLAITGLDAAIPTHPTLAAALDAAGG